MRLLDFVRNDVRDARHCEEPLWVTKQSLGIPLPARGDCFAPTRNDRGGHNLESS